MCLVVFVSTVQLTPATLPSSLTTSTIAQATLSAMSSDLQWLLLRVSGGMYTACNYHRLIFVCTEQQLLHREAGSRRPFLFHRGRSFSLRVCTVVRDLIDTLQGNLRNLHSFKFSGLANSKANAFHRSVEIGILNNLLLCRPSISRTLPRVSKLRLANPRHPHTLFALAGLP